MEEKLEMLLKLIETKKCYREIRTQVKKATASTKHAERPLESCLLDDEEEFFVKGEEIDEGNILKFIPERNPS
jgi:hypothetical protein